MRVQIRLYSNSKLSLDFYSKIKRSNLDFYRNASTSLIYIFMTFP